MRKNYVMLRHHLLYLQGELTPAMTEFLEQNALSYTTNLNVRHSRAQEIARKENDLQIIETIVRSGQEVNVESDLLVMGRINSGSRITVQGNFIAMDEIHGLVECNGAFMLIKPTPKAVIIFNGVEIDCEQLENRFYKVRFTTDEIRLTPISKESFWA